MANPFAWGRKNNVSEKDYFSAAIFTSRPSAIINESQAIQIPSVKAAVDLISNSISTLPIYLYQEVNESDIRKVQDDRVSTINHSSNKIDTAQVLKKKIVTDYLLHGRAFVYKKDGKLFHLEANKVDVHEFTEDGFTVSRREFVYNGFKTVTLDESEVIVVDSGSLGVLIHGEKVLRTALSQLDYSSSLLENAAVPTGILKSASRLTETAINRLREAWNSLYVGSRKTGKTIILEEGLEFSPLSMRPDELQLTESNKQIVSEISKLFNIPESMINSAANKYNSLEQNSVQFLRNTLAPIITSIENAFDKNLLDEAEQIDGYYFRFDTSEILRTTEETKIKAISEAFNKGIISFNQAATKLDLPKEEKDFRLLSIGNVMKYEDGQMVYLNLGPQTNQTEEVNTSNENGTEIDTDVPEI